MKPLSDEKVIDSWHKNAKPWTQAVRESQIPSRKLVTDQAIINTITQLSALSSVNTILDIGCGEGWLSQALLQQQLDVQGIDVVPELINAAQEYDAKRFHIMSYAELVSGKLAQRFDLAVCNFSLIGKDDVESLFAAMPSLLNPSGYFVIQTLHPQSSCGDNAYIDGWRKGSWQGFSESFCDPAPWYFRTTSSWCKLFTNHGLQLHDLIEPVNPTTQLAASLIIVGRLKT